MSESSLGHLPARERWEFDESVASVFEDMLRRSIPQLDAMRDVVTNLADRYARPGSSIVDLGASRGDAIAPLIARAELRNVFELVETSKPMLEVCRTRFAGEIATRRVFVHGTDLRAGYPSLSMRASVTLAVLTMQFLPINHRQRILRDVFKATMPGGALIVVEKVLGSDAEADEALTALYHAEKEAVGYSRDEIDRKAASLEGVLVPCTARWNEDLLRGAGFTTVECVWRCLSFGAWLAVRSS